LELEVRFGAVSSETQVTKGHWSFQGKSYRDELVRTYLDVPDLPENRQFFLDLKPRLMERFHQLDISG
jgi:hypothetical protein